MINGRNPAMDRCGRVPRTLHPMWIGALHLNPAILGFIGPIQLHGHNALEARVALTGPAADRTSQYQVFGLPCQAPLFWAALKSSPKLGFRGPRERSHACSHPPQGDDDAYRKREVVQPREGLWIHPAPGWRQGRVRPHFCSRTRGG